MKQYMVLKMASGGVAGVLTVMPMLGAVSQQIAEEAVERLTREDPESVFMIQEVGAA